MMKKHIYPHPSIKSEGGMVMVTRQRKWNLAYCLSQFCISLVHLACKHTMMTKMIMSVVLILIELMKTISHQQVCNEDKDESGLQ